MINDASKLRKLLQNMKVRVVPVIIGSLGMMPNGQGEILKELEFGVRVLSIQVMMILKTA